MKSTWTKVTVPFKCFQWISIDRLWNLSYALYILGQLLFLRWTFGFSCLLIRFLHFKPLFKFRHRCSSSDKFTDDNKRTYCSQFCFQIKICVHQVHATVMVTVLRLETFSIAHVLVGLLEITAKLVNSIHETPVFCVFMVLNPSLITCF